MSEFLTKRSGAAITPEEARAAVETELFALKLARRMTSAEKDAFCQIAASRLSYQSEADRMGEVRAWAESWQSLWLPEEPVRGEHIVGAAMSSASPGKPTFTVSWPRWRMLLRH